MVFRLHPVFIYWAVKSLNQAINTNGVINQVDLTGEIFVLHHIGVTLPVHSMGRLASVIGRCTPKRELTAIHHSVLTTYKLAPLTNVIFLKNLFLSCLIAVKWVMIDNVFEAYASCLLFKIMTNKIMVYTILSKIHNYANVFTKIYKDLFSHTADSLMNGILL